MRVHAMIVVCGVALGVMGGCEESSSSSSGGASAPAASWRLAAAPAGAAGIVQVKAEANEGDEVVIRGIIGGRKEPMTASSGLFVIVDEGLFNRCTSEPGHCAAPWDYCCADGKELAANAATVQVVGADGKALDLTSGGLSPLDTVVVVGEVGPRASADVLTVKATGVYKE